MSQIIEDCQKELRLLFKNRYDIKCGSKHGPWNDSPQCDRQVFQNDTWLIKHNLDSRQKDLLKKGSTTEWDVSLLCKVLEFSSFCFLATQVDGTKCKTLKQKSQEVYASIDSFDFTAASLKEGDNIILSIEGHPFYRTVTKVEKNHFDISECVKEQFKKAVLYIKDPEYDAVTQLRRLRNEFAHSATSKMCKTNFDTAKLKVESAYSTLGVSDGIVKIKKNSKFEIFKLVVVLCFLSHYWFDSYRLQILDCYYRMYSINPLVCFCLSRTAVVFTIIATH